MSVKCTSCNDTGKAPLKSAPQLHRICSCVAGDVHKEQIKLIKLLKPKEA